MFIECVVFIFVIIIFFDICDLELDQEKEVVILFGCLGIQCVKKVVYVVLGLMLFVVIWNIIYGYYFLGVVLGLFFLVVLSGLFIYGVDVKCYDYYYIGLLDGIMILQVVLVGFVICFFSFG